MSEEKVVTVGGEYQYSVSSLIGHGAFAVVYRANKITDKNSFVAVKAITKKNVAKCKTLLFKEIVILKQITQIGHENLVAMIGCEESDTSIYVIMEYCNGGDLSDYLAKMKTLSEQTIRLFLLQLADAMKALKDLGIIHRDLKPQNILLKYDKAITNPLPCHITLKIADFGFARILGEDGMAATLCGSPMYMAPEVIMSQKYDASADLWSLGTIVYQALTGHAPFTASTPQQLRRVYEENPVLTPDIPSSTSPELTSLLLGLIKKNPEDRLKFDLFFNHKFLQRNQNTKRSPISGDSPLPIYGTSPVASKLRPKPASPIRTPIIQGAHQQESSRSILSSSPEDDYVIVPKNGFLEQSTESMNKAKGTILPKIAQSPVEADSSASSPPRPCTLPIPAEPVPIPRRNSQIRRNSENENKEEGTNYSVAGTCVPRSAPINMRRQESKPDIDIDISSLSPPPVKFMIGTPPGGRRRSTSGSSYSETPPPQVWTVSPVAVSRTSALSTISNSPLRRSGTSPPVLSGALTRMPMLSSPNLTDNNNLGKVPIFSTRAMTLPEISEMDNLQSYFTDNDHPVTLYAPELPEETLLGREHNETLAKINFVLALSNCIISIAAQKSSPMISLVDSVICKEPVNDFKTEKLVLLIRALQLLSSGLTLASKQIREGTLKPSSTVKNVVATLNSKFKQTLSECRQLNTDGLISKLKSPEYTADSILYYHAVQMCQAAALDELFGKADDCAERYQTAQILLHSLSQQVNCPCDKEKLIEYKLAVEKRLHILQQQGYIYTTDFS